MDHRAQHLVKIIEHIGAPLVRASVLSSDSGEASLHAKTVAQLLTHSVKLGIDISAMSTLVQGEGDSTRVALSAVAARLIADVYERKKSAPTDADLDSVKAAFQAVLKLSDTLSTDEKGAMRLDDLVVDNAQKSLQYMTAFVPLVNAGSTRDFDEAVLRDMSARLVDDAKSMALRLSGDGGALAHIPVLKALVSLFVSCLGVSDDVSSVWGAYEKRVTMLEVLSNGFAGQAVSSGSLAVEPMAPPPAEEVFTDLPDNLLREKIEANSIVSGVEPGNDDVLERDDGDTSDDQSSSDSSSGGPMSFFSKGG